MTTERPDVVAAGRPRPRPTPSTSEPTSNAKRSVLPAVAIGITVLMWASAFVGIRALGATFTPGGLTLGRLAVGSAALGILVLTRRPA